jgi:ankyrin repeat protein
VQRNFDDLNSYPAVDESHVLDAVILAVSLGADVNAVNLAGDTALHLAAARGYNSVVQFLADKGAKLNVKNKLGQTPLALSVVNCGARSAHCAGPSQSRSADLLRKLGATE